MNKNLIKIISIFVALILFIPVGSVNAGITDNPNTTSYKTKLAKSETGTEEVSYDTDIDAYILNKRIEAESTYNLEEDIKTEWLNLFVSENGVYKYPVYLQTVFVGVTVDENSILVGDPDEISGTPVYNYEVRYKEVTVTKAPNPNEIREINLTVEIPEVGSEITIENDDWDTQSPQASITVPSGAKYALDTTYDHYMYYINSDSYSPFSGKFEKGKSYVMEIWLRATEPYFFIENAKVIINGEEFSIDDFDDSEVSILYEFTPKDKEYKILDGANQTFNTDSSDDLTVRANGDFNNLIELQVDGTKLDSSNYELKEGSTIAILKNSYLKTLSNGTHTLTFVYNDGSVSTTFEVTNINNPKTGDNIIVYVLILVLGIGFLLFKKVKKTN